MSKKDKKPEEGIDIPDISRLTPLGKYALSFPIIITIVVIVTVYCNHKGVYGNVFSGILWDALMVSVAGIAIADIVGTLVFKEQPSGGNE